MRLATAPILADEPILPFPSLSALRSAHSELLKRQAANGNTPDLVEAVEGFLQRGQETGALLDAPDDRVSAQSALDYWASTLYRIGQRDVDPLLAEFDPALAPALEDALCPYVGLEAFHENDRELFFGRSRLIGQMISCLKENRLVAALGPSGSGKSSLILGGLLPALKSGALPGSESWLYLPPMVPGSEPLKNLARALESAAADPAKLERDPAHLARLLSGDRPAVLVIDQFEEVFTLCEDNHVRQAFIASLLSVLQTPEPQHRVVLTLRSDYEPFVARLPDLQPFFDQGQLRMTPLSAAELRDAIEKPAERIGLKFEDGVVPALLEDILGEPAGLPLLQFTLLKLWESRERNRVTWEAYRRLGGGRLALARSADALYDSLIPETQVIARRILLRMVRPGSGLEVVNNRIRRESLYQLGHDPGLIDQTLERLVRGRLVRLTPGDTPADAQIEVAHEALVRNWPRLVDWLEETRMEMTTRRRWEARAAEWVRLGRGQGGLLDEVQLAEAERWIESPEAAELGHDEQLTALVKASREAVDRMAREKRRKVFLRWAALLAVVLYFAGWAAFAWKVKQTELVEKAKKEVRALQKEKRQLSDEKQALESGLVALQAKAALDSRIAREQILEARTQFEQATLQAAEATKVVRQARLDIEKARTEEATAQTRISEAQAKEQEAQAKQGEALSLMTTAERKIDEAERKIGEAEELQLSAATKIQEIDAKIQNSERQLASLTESLEKELADGGGVREVTVSRLFTNMKDLIGQRFEQRRFRKSYRPVRIGTSASTEPEKSLPGTICCVVYDSEGHQYLLSRASVFGEPGAAIVQPSAKDGMGGKLDIVAEVVRTGSGNPNRAAAIARLRNGIMARPVIPKFGGILGIAQVKAGDDVRQVGRGSGIQKGKVLRVEEDGTIVTNIRPAPGDTGGPVLTPDRKLIGMLWGWSKIKKEAYVAPIDQLLKELDVDLVVAVKKK